MSIVRSGLVKPVYVICQKTLAGFEVGKKYELILDMGTMYVIKTPAGQDAVVPKESFTVAKD